MNRLLLTIFLAAGIWSVTSAEPAKMLVDQSWCVAVSCPICGYKNTLPDRCKHYKNAEVYWIFDDVTTQEKDKKIAELEARITQLESKTNRFEQTFKKAAEETDAKLRLEGLDTHVPQDIYKGTFMLELPSTIFPPKDGKVLLNKTPNP